MTKPTALSVTCPHGASSHDEGLVKGTLKGLQLLRYPRSKPICATRPVSEHDQPHMRSPLISSCTKIPLSAGRAQEDENHSRKRRFRPWLASVRRGIPGSRYYLPIASFILYARA